MEDRPPITSLDQTAFATAYEQHASPEAQVVRSLAGLPMYQAWSHQPIPAQVEAVLMDLTEQELMTTAAACLLRLAKMQNTSTDQTADAA